MAGDGDWPKYIAGPLAVLAANLVYKTISETRTENLTEVRLVRAMINEINHVRESWKPHASVFSQAYDEGRPDSLFSRKISSDPRYFPYSVSNESTTSVFSADEAPAKSFSFLSSDTIKALVDFHDASALLTASIADLREDVFRDLPAERKLAALGAIVGLFKKGQDAFEPCRDALLGEERSLTDRSAAWVVLFPVRSGSYPFLILIGWILLNMMWHALAG